MDELFINLAANAPIYIGLVALIAELRQSRTDCWRRYDELLDLVLDKTELTMQDVREVHSTNGNSHK